MLIIHQGDGSLIRRLLFLPRVLRENSPVRHWKHTPDAGASSRKQAARAPRCGSRLDVKQTRPEGRQTRTCLTPHIRAVISQVQAAGRGKKKKEKRNNSKLKHDHCGIQGRLNVQTPAKSEPVLLGWVVRVFVSGVTYSFKNARSLSEL